MFYSSKKLLILWSIGIFSVSSVSVCLAAETTSSSSGTGRSLTGFFRRLFNYPGKAVKETAGMTANTLNNTGEKVLSKTGEHLSKGELPQAVGQTVQGTLETTGQTAAETVQVPVKAAEEDNTTSQ